MMKLHIRLKNGVPFEHPILEENLLDVFPNTDLTSGEFIPFERKHFEGVLGVFEMVESSYEIFNGVCQDVYSVRPMTELEKAAKIQYLESYAFDVIASMKIDAQKNFENSITDADKTKWQAFLDELNAYKLDDYADLKLPYFPK